MFKVNNKDSVSRVSIINLEHVIVNWERRCVFRTLSSIIMELFAKAVND